MEPETRCDLDSIHSLEGELSLDFVRVVEEAAIAAARTMGRGERRIADQAAVEAMRRVLDSVPIAGTVVIGEGERDQAPMLYISRRYSPNRQNGPNLIRP